MSEAGKGGGECVVCGSECWGRGKRVWCVGVWEWGGGGGRRREWVSQESECWRGVGGVEEVGCEVYKTIRRERAEVKRGGGGGSGVRGWVVWGGARGWRCAAWGVVAVGRAGE